MFVNFFEPTKTEYSWFVEKSLSSQPSLHFCVLQGVFEFNQGPATTMSVSTQTKTEWPEGKISTIYIAAASAAPMKSIEAANLMERIGIEGDRYATSKGTYSGAFLSEPGRNLTLISEDAIRSKMKNLPMKDHFTMDKLRRNIVVQGLTAQDINDMVGREIRMGTGCRLFVHRRNVPCKYREAETQCPNFMNTFWEDCGVCCEILVGGMVNVGDTVSVLPNAPYQPKRCNVGLKPKGFFTKPKERSLEDVKLGIIPVHIAIALCLWDPQGFVQVEEGYRSVGQYFWSPKAYRAGMFVKTYVRTPLLLAIIGGVTAIAVQAVKGLKEQ
jgi:MOSC domain-containing protein YiiM